MLIAIGSARARPARREDLVSAAREMTAATRDDDGCVSYGFYADLDDPETVVSVEVWRDRQTLDAHMTHGHTDRFLGAVPDLVDGTPSMSLHHVTDPARSS